MLYFIVGIFFAVFILSIIVDADEAIGYVLIGFGLSLGILCVVLYQHNSVKATADNQIAVLEERNEVVLSQIEPLVEKYLQYESNTYKELKQNPQMLLSLSAYPELKGNEFVQSQINIVIENQNKITDLKLAKSKLNSYKMWIFVGE